MVSKKNLWIFGDSNSCPFTNIEVSHFGKPYIEYKGYVPKIYSEIISEKLNFTHKNFAVGGSDNYTIFQSICSKINEIEKDDLIIVNWTSYNRFRILHTIDGNIDWLTIVPNYIPNTFSKNEISFLEQQQIFRNESLLIKKEIMNWILILNNIFSNRITYWTQFDLKIDNVIYPNNFFKIQDLTFDTHGEIHDLHYDESTHKKLAELLLNKKNISII